MGLRVDNETVLAGDETVLADGGPGEMRFADVTTQFRMVKDDDETRLSGAARRSILRVRLSSLLKKWRADGSGRQRECSFEREVGSG
jgi:hypothetical protein